MNAEEKPSEIFKRDYEMLDLHDRADWKTARASYRRLVHLWHPDRYTQRPREKAHAQQQFIELTKSYNSLRSFHRTHQRLPFEAVKRQASTQTKPANLHKGPQTRTKVDNFEKGLLNGDGKSRTKKRKTKKNNGTKIWMFVALAMMMIATIAVSLVLDLNANKANIEKGKEVLRQAPASEFMPSPAEIRKSQTRGAFVQPTK